MSEKITRKQFLRQGTKYVAGVAVGTTAINLIGGGKAGASTLAQAWPFPYTALDPEKVRVYGHDEYFAGKGCCQGSFGAIVKALSEEMGEPWSSFPQEMMAYGGGGGAGWGATCGAINGSSALINLVTEKSTANKLVSELFGWYTQAQLPTDASNQIGVENGFGDNRLAEALVQNKSKSPLCHVSVTMWCVSAQKKQSDLDRKERCARVTGDAAAYAVQLLNDNLNSVFNPLYVMPQVVTDCNACHNAGTPGNVASKMECDTCHGDPHAASGIRQTSELALSYHLGTNYPNPFNPSTTLSFSIPKGEHVKLYIYDGHGRLISKLLDGEYQTPGEYQVTWDGKSDFGIPVTSGAYFARMSAGKFSRTQKMMMMK
jgi:hypothetical protein